MQTIRCRACSKLHGIIPNARDPEFLDTSRYSENLLAWQKALGADQVLVTLYDDLRDNPQSYVDHIVDFLGIRRFRLTTSQSN